MQVIPTFMRRSVRAIISSTVVLSVAAGCGQQEARPADSGALSTIRFDSAFRLVDSVALEVDTASPLVAVSAFAVAANGDIVIADASERRVFVYGPSGRRLRVLGRSGDGPGEFRQPRNLAIASNGDVLVVEAVGKFHRFRGDSLIETLQLDSVTLVSSMDMNSDSTMLITTSNGKSGAVVEYTLDGRVRQRVDLFTKVPVRNSPEDQRWRSFLQLRGAACNGKMRAAASISDTVWSIDPATLRFSAKRVAPSGYNAPRLPGAADNANTVDPFKWINQFDVIQGIFCSGSAFAFSFVRGARNIGDPQVFMLTLDGESWRAFSEAPPVIAMRADTLITLRDNGTADYVLRRFVAR